MKIPYYVTKNGRGYWQPKVTGRNPLTGKPIYLTGFEPRCLGEAGPQAEGMAVRLYQAYERARRGGMSGSQENAPRWPRGSIGQGFDRYRLTEEWAKKAVRTREDWERAWARIGPIFGDVDPKTVTLEDISEFRLAVERAVSLREAHRCLKIWRALWQVLAALKLCRPDEDPSFGVRNTEPKAGTGQWAQWEIARIAKRAWREGFHGLAALLAATWDGMMSPVDARTVTGRQWIRSLGGQAFVFPRGKTGVKTVAPLTRRACRVIDAYLARSTIANLDRSLFRTRRGAAYTKNSLAEDFRDIRALVFPGDVRTILAIRRSGAMEATAGQVDPKALSEAMGNSLAESKALQRAYTPAQIATVSTIPEARRRGRQAIRKNGSGT